MPANEHPLTNFVVLLNFACYHSVLESWSVMVCKYGTELWMLHACTPFIMEIWCPVIILLMELVQIEFWCTLILTSASLQQEENRDLIDRWMALKAKDAEKLNTENDSILKLVASFLFIRKVSPLYGWYVLVGMGYDVWLVCKATENFWAWYILFSNRGMSSLQQVFKHTTYLSFFLLLFLLLLLLLLLLFFFIERTLAKGKQKNMF